MRCSSVVPSAALFPAWFLFVLVAAPVSAQVVDTTLFSTDRPVMAMARDGNTIYLGGSFSIVGTASGGGVTSDPGYPRANGTVYAVVADGQGGWYLGGNFTSVGGRTIGGLAHILADGTVDSWDPQLGSHYAAIPIVTALAISGTTLYVGGIFSEAAGVPRDRLASFDLSTGGVTAWNPGADDRVVSLVVGANAVYAGGNFTQIGGAERNRVAALDPVTGAATAWDARIPPYDGSFPLSVSALALGNDVLYVGGLFQTIGGATRRCIAALRTSNGDATPWNPDAGEPGPNGVTAFAVDGSLVYVGGQFQTIGGQARSRIAAIDSSGTATAWNPNANSQVTCLAVQRGIVYAGGAFSNIGGAYRSCLAALDAVTGAATEWDPGPNSTVFALALTDVAMYAGGRFTFWDYQGHQTTRRGLAAFDATTNELLDWNPDADGSVEALAVHDGRVYVGGRFTNIGGLPRHRLAAVDGVTGAPTSWAPDVNDVVHALVLSGDTLFAGGNFQSIDGVPRSRLAAFDATTGTLLARSFDADGEVMALATAADRVYAGGRFTSIDGAGIPFLAAIDPSLGVISGWYPDRSVGPVHALAVSGTALYAGGDGGVAAVELATGDTTAFRPQFACPVIGMAVGGGIAYAGGGCEEIVALDAGSGATLPWSLEATNIRAMLLDGESLYVGGGFSVASGNSIQTGLVRLSTFEIPTPTLADFHATRTREGVRLEWRITDRAVDAHVERAAAPAGPWRDLDLAPFVTNGLASAMDVEATGATWWYRLVVRLVDGSTVRIGPIEVGAPATVTGSGIRAVSPNPAARLVRIELVALVRERVRVSLLDIGGREVHVLHDGILEPGTHSLLWEARRGNGPMPSGVYFVRWRSASHEEQRRIVVAR